MAKNEMIETHEDLLKMLDQLLQEQRRFDWDSFYQDRERKVPFFINSPDENLVTYFKKGLFNPGQVLELGCGPGRNAIYFAEQGCTVDAVDISREAIEWAKDRALESGIEVCFIQENIFSLSIKESNYDIIYDSGCFHHIPPHRRMSYLELLRKALKPGGMFALTCFVEGGELGGSAISDYEVYRLRSLQGGLGFTEEKLTRIFKEFEVLELRKMEEHDPDTEFGSSSLWAALFRKK
ncbi:class I SAM-dependent methyltransferase [Peribacillus sp. SCS-155]|uniref:class I SAM-dependent methyltransferase n=1 Tax=Peribacillus sedimenti TaxID=3115297 RepID=UPI003905FC44